jgi:hypothetical protein
MCELALNGVDLKGISGKGMKEVKGSGDEG